MNKSKNILLFISVVILFGLVFILYRISMQKSNQPITNQDTYLIDDNTSTSVKPSVFSDGLPNPDSVINYTLDDFGTGPAKKYIYYIDIDKNGTLDKITKTFIETGNAHSYYEYTIEIKTNGEYIDITPKNFHTINGAECDLQQIQFPFVPQFRAKLISRELGENLWNQPTMAKQKTFMLNGNNWKTYAETELKPVCDVKELF